MKKAIALLSGGLDSTVSLCLAQKEYKVVLGLTFDYCQKSAKREISSSCIICKLLGIPHKVIKLDWMKSLTKTALVDEKQKIPVFKPGKIEKSDAESVWVPNRNGLFISIGAVFAEAMGCDAVITGFNREEAVSFPDNSDEFVDAVNKSLEYSTLNKVRVKSYTSGMTKTEILKAGAKVNAPLKYIWSCYGGGKKHCGKCESCVRLINASRRFKRICDSLPNASRRLTLVERSNVSRTF